MEPDPNSTSVLFFLDAVSIESVFPCHVVGTIVTSNLFSLITEMYGVQDHEKALFSTNRCDILKIRTNTICHLK